MVVNGKKWKIHVSIRNIRTTLKFSIEKFTLITFYLRFWRVQIGYCHFIR